MWKLYLKSNEGIALQTSFGLLSSELNNSERTIRLGRVRYCDYKTASIPGGKPQKIGSVYMTGLFAPFTLIGIPYCASDGSSTELKRPELGGKYLRCSRNANVAA